MTYPEGTPPTQWQQPQPTYPPQGFALAKPPKTKMTRKNKIVVLSVVVVAALVALSGVIYRAVGGVDAAGMCESAISSELKSPSTATFSNVQVQKLPGFINVVGSVVAENSFGAMLRSTFNCSIGTDENGNKVVTSAVVS